MVYARQSPGPRLNGSHTIIAPGGGRNRLARRLLLLVIPGLVIPASAGCTRRPHPVAPAQGPAASGEPKAGSTGNEIRILVVYHRTGGFIGTDDRVVVWSDGVTQAAGRLFGTGAAKVGNEQMEPLRDLLRGWEALPSPAPSGAPDAFIVEVEYAGRAVIADDASPHVPEQFRRVREALEAIARQVAAPAKDPAN
jgi:hypothetical protein